MTVGAKINADGAGPDIVAADVTLTGFGTTPVLAIASGSNDARGKFTVTADAVPAADATIELAFQKAKDAAPFVFVQRCDEDQAAGDFRVTAIDVDGFTITFEGTPVDTEVYEVEYLVVE